MFSGRRKDESAISGQMSSGEVGDLSGQVSDLGDHHVDLANPGQISDLSQMIQAAEQQGNVTVTHGPTIDATGNEDLRNAIMKTLKEHGVDAQKGQQITVTDPTLMAALFKTIGEHRGEMQQMQAQAMQQFQQLAESGQLQGMMGGNVAGMAAFGAMGAGAQTPGQMPAPQTGATADVSALEKLQALKQSGALTDEEFEAEKKKLLGS
jgi:hypothetical protein